MKNHYLNIIVILLSGLLVSCSNDYESVPLEDVTIDYVFNKDDSLGTKANQFLNQIYLSLPTGYNRIDGYLLDAATDDAIGIDEGTTTISKLAQGIYTSYNLITQDMIWGTYYSTIRSTSIFVNNIDNVPVKDTTANGLSVKYAWKAEARFIRALTYFELLKRYGGVPLMGDEVRELGDDLELPRNSFAECVHYIVGECDDIKDSLLHNPVPNPSVNSHRPTKGSALALKARVLLYAASPLFNGGNIDPNNPLTGYTDYDVNRWDSAAIAAQDVINLNAYSLIPHFKDIFLVQNNKEIIFFRQGSNSNYDVESNNGPIGFTANAKGKGKTNPTQELVDAFPMISGKAIDETGSGYDPSNPYLNRDPRLDSTIIHNGTPWLNSTMQTYIGGANNPIISSQSIVTATTRTSYYMKKFMGRFETATEYSNVSRDWISFRYAEVLLNYAEAQNEFSGPDASVYQVLKDIHKRAGITAGDDDMYGLKSNMTQDEMRNAIHNERRIEMAFEEQRYWDIRRWKIAEDVMTKPLHGEYILRSNDGKLTYSTKEVFTPEFTERMYLYPIPYTEVVKNSNMKQNPGWEVE